MNKNLFYKFVTIFGFIVFLALLVVFVYLKFQNAKNEPQPASVEVENQDPRTQEAYVSIFAEVDKNSKKIILFMEPMQTNGNIIKLSAFEMNIKVFANDFEVIEAKRNSIAVDNNLKNAGWKFPILNSSLLETGEVAIKIASYFENDEGFELSEKTPIIAIDLIKTPQNEIFVSEFVKENTHFYSRSTMDPVPFVIK